MSYWNHTSQTYVRRSTVNGLLRRGLIEHSADGFVVLTDSGLAALQEAWAQRAKAAHDALEREERESRELASVADAHERTAQKLADAIRNYLRHEHESTPDDAMMTWRSDSPIYQLAAALDEFAALQDARG